MSTRVYPKANTLVRVRETKLLGREQWQALLAARGFEAALALLADWGYLPGGTPELGGANGLVNQKLAELFHWLGEIAPDPRVTALFTLRYDLNNAKALFREEAGDKSSGLWMDAAGYTREQLALQIRTEGAPFAQLFRQFRQSFKEHGSWQRIALLGERFYYARLAALAWELKEPEISRFVEICVDYHNLSLFQEHQGDGASVPEAGYIPGGTLAPSVLEDRHALSRTPYGEALSRPALFDTLKDNDLMRRAIGAKMVAFGLVPICGYAFAAVTELKNLRLVLTAKENGLPMEKAAERMRILYEL